MDKEKALFESLIAEREEYRAIAAWLREHTPALRQAEEAARQDAGELLPLAELLDEYEDKINEAKTIRTRFAEQYAEFAALLRAAKTEVTADGFTSVFIHAAQDARRTLSEATRA